MATMVAVFMLPLLVVVCLVSRMRQRPKLPRLVWGPVPIISNKYWSQALAQAGYHSRTLMFEYYPKINQASDYDHYCDEIFTRWPRMLGRPAAHFLAPYAGFIRGVWNFDIQHLNFGGGYLGWTALWRLESCLLGLAGVKTVLMPYGADAYMYSRIADPCLRHVLNLSYPQMAREEKKVEQRVFYWSKNADAVVCHFMCADGMPRNDVGVFSAVIIDTNLWQQQQIYSQADGRNGAVKIIHTPNHRGFKGTEYLMHSVKQLQAEGLQVELLLIENMQNEEVRRLMAGEADILAEQFVACAYAMSGMEGMASGLPVMANLDLEVYTRIFRRYGYLDECPILSTTIESLTDNLRLLVTRPELRMQLGRAGRTYVEKYHSARTAQFLFPRIYDRIWHGREGTLCNLFHPILGEYAMNEPRVDHPLVENKLVLSGGQAP